MKIQKSISALILALVLLTQPLLAKERLLFMAGAAAAPVIQELGEAFTKQTGIIVDTSIGGSGTLLSQIKLARKGDIYFPASVDFIDKAREENLIDAETITPIVYLIPAICVVKGNPKNIQSLRDLCRPGLKIAIGNPETVVIGAMAVELAETFLNREEKAAFKANLVAYTQNAEKTANALVLNSVDAVIGWRVFEHWKPEKIEALKPKADEFVRISYLALAATKYADKAVASRFIKFMTSKEGLEYFKKFNYFTSSQEAIDYLGTKKPIGGKPFRIPDDWMN